tara:strand:- start:1322 stop:2122 length:801 start_codon:yes stop_codon:yes gene_type:complete
MNRIEERELRSSIRSLIQHVKLKRLTEEDELRGIIRSLFVHEYEALNERQTADVDPTPNKSTGINVLEELLKKIVPVLEDDFKSMTTDPEQRKSFRAHIVQAIIDTLTPVEANTKAGNQEAAEDTLEEEIDIEITDDAAGPQDDDKFIDIRTDSEKSADDEPDDPRDDFGIEGADETGRNIAYSTFKKIQSNIIDSYELLSNPEDQELFYDYLIANTKLYFDKFETELSGSVEEPTNQAYDMAKSEVGGEAPDLSEPTADEVDLGL